MSIYKKLNEVQKKVSFVKKDKTLGFGNNQFKIVTHDAVLGQLRDHLTDAGIVIIPSQVEKGLSIPGQTKSGGEKIRFEALYDIKFLDIEDDSFFVIRTEAHAEDNSDKASSKAITYAVKNAMLKAFLLETGEEDKEAVENTINLTQVKLLQGLVTSTETDEKEFLAFYGAEKYTDMPINAFQDAMHKLQAKQKKAKA